MNTGIGTTMYANMGGRKIHIDMYNFLTIDKIDFVDTSCTNIVPHGFHYQNEYFLHC
jgi:hypothetical protein